MYRVCVIAVFIFCLITVIVGCADDDEQNTKEESEQEVITVGDDYITLTINRRLGTFDILIDDFLYLQKVTSAIEVGTGGLVLPVNNLQAASVQTSDLRPVDVQESADGIQVRIVHFASILGQMTTVLTILPDQQGLTAQLELTAGQLPNLVSLIPLYIGNDPQRGLFFKSEPSDLLILQNGSELAFDFYVDLYPGDALTERGLINQYFKKSRSASSDWNALIYDRNNAEGLNFGFLSFDRVIPEVIIGHEAQKAPVQNELQGFAEFQARSGFLIPRDEPQGQLIVSELFWLNKFSGKPQGALESYARRIADRLNITLAHSPVSSWDSWYVYGDKIDQEILEENLAGLAEYFLEYGLTAMQVDLGWDNVWGNWSSYSKDFPDGMAAMAEKIKSAGLNPEIWISPFNAMRRSQILTDYPDLEAPFHPLFLLMMQPGSKPIDLSRYEAIEYNRLVGGRLAQWGYGGAKFDFAYYQCFITELFDPQQTIIEAYRKALDAFNEGFGDDKFLINILLMGTNYGKIDSMRIGIDTWACWGEAGEEDCPETENTDGRDGMGLRYALKTLARRYYYNNVIWVNHPDQIFFRDYLSLEAQRAWATVVALSGSVISLGEEIASMTTEEIETFRRLIPNLGVTGVPQDLMEREYPEVWLTPLTDRQPGGYVLGLYNWGNNFDLTQNPYGEIPETTRRHDLLLADLGLSGRFYAFEFWTQTDVGVVDEFILWDVPPRDCRVIILRPMQDRPFLVASNRHVSQGGTDLHDPVWRERTLSWTQDLVAGFAHTVYIHPAGETKEPSVANDGDAEIIVRPAGDLIAIDMTTTLTGPVRISLEF